jgi:trimeric autotransporter adhesin
MKKNVLMIMAVLLTSLLGMGQISGTKSIPGDYTSVASAIAALNASGVGAGGVTFNVAAGYSETFASRTDGLITATGTQANPIVFQKSGTGANPVLTAATPGTGNYDYIICIGGGDYISFDGINIKDNPANTTSTAQMEYGFAFLKASATDGAQHNTLKNDTISMSSNTKAWGVYLDNWNYAIPGTSLTVTALSGTNSWNKFNGLTLNNCYGGFYLTGYADVSPFAFYDQDNEIGTEAGNTLKYSAMSGTTSAISYGINAISQNGLVIANNTFAGTISLSNTSARYYTMFLTDSDNADLDIFNNTVSITFTGSGHFYGPYVNGMGRNGTNNTVNFYNNQVINNTFSTHTAGNVVYAYVTTGAVHANCYNNLISNNAIGSATANSTGLAYYLWFRSDPANKAGSSMHYHHNTISNNTRNTGTGGPVTALTYFLYFTGSTDTLKVYNNIIDNNTAVAGNAYGIMNAHIGKNKNIHDNTISNITGRIAGLFGIYNANGTQTTYIHRNRIQNLRSAANPNPAFPTLYSVYGITQSTGNNTYYFNNYIGQLYAPASQMPSAIIGIIIYGINNYYTGLYNNTLYLDGTSANEGFGTRGISAETGVQLDLRNNIIVNNTIPTGSGQNKAYYRSGDNLSTYQSVSNNNDFYAGTPGPNNLIFSDGTNEIQTLAEYQDWVRPADAQSITENPPFVNVTTGTYDLHLSGSVLTQCESGASVVTDPLAITTDFDNDPRYPNAGYPDNPSSPAIAPDMGADEFAGLTNDLLPPNIGYTPLADTSGTVGRTLAASITDPSGVPTSGTGLPVLYWRINNGSWVSSIATWVSGNQFAFTIGDGAVLHDTIYYYVAAQDMAPGINVGCRPAVGAGGFTSDPPACSTPPSSPDYYVIVGALSGVYTVGIGKDYNTITDAVADLNMKEVVGPVVFELWDNTFSASETFPLVINPYLGASPVHPVTFRPKSGGASTITGSSDQGILKLNGCRFITIDGSNSESTDRSLTWENTSTTAGSYAIGLFNSYPQGASNCFIKNNKIRSSAQITNDTYGIFLDATVGGFNNITIDNNNILSARNGIKFSGEVNQKATNGIITDNIIGSLTPADEIKFQGIVLSDAVNTLIRGNEIIGPASGNTNNNQVGILLSPGAEYTTIDGNRIHHFNSTNSSGRSSAITLNTQNSDTPTEITNNLIYAMKANRYPTGIYISNGGNVQVTFNTVRFTDTTFTSSATSSFYSACLWIATGAQMDVRNNIFLNKQQCVSSTNTAPKTYAVYSGSAASAFSVTDYNDYFVNDVVPSSGLSGRVGFLATDRSTLANWQSATGQDVHSLSVNPAFVSTSDLHPVNPDLNNTGIYLAAVPNDFNGISRTNPPDIGAYEYTLPVASINTLDATAIGETTATLNGNINTSNEIVTVSFEYGPDTGYGSSIAAVPSPVKSVTSTAVSANLSGLTPFSTVHFRVKGITSGGATVYGNDMTFTTGYRTLNLKVFLEGLYSAGGLMNKAQNETGDQFPGTTADKVTVELHNATTYSTIEYTSGLVELSTGGNISIATIPATLSGSYYITVRHRNSIETTTATAVSFAGTTVSYDFTTGATQAYGDNQKDAGGGYYAIWGGDVSQDGIVDSGDMNPVDNAATAVTFGYVAEDVNGDGIVDSSDMNVVDNNSTAIIMAQVP